MNFEDPTMAHADTNMSTDVDHEQTATPAELPTGGSRRPNPPAPPARQEITRERARLIANKREVMIAAFVGLIVAAGTAAVAVHEYRQAVSGGAQ